MPPRRDRPSPKRTAPTRRVPYTGKRDVHAKADPTPERPRIPRLHDGDIEPDPHMGRHW